MKLRRGCCLFICLFAALYSVSAATPLVGNPGTAFSLISENLQTVSIGQSFNAEHEISATTYPAAHYGAIFGAGITGSVKLHNDVGLVRVVLLDQDDEEYLVYEVYSLIADEYAFDVDNGAVETRILDGVSPKSYRVEILNADFTLQSIHYATQLPVTRTAINDIQHQVRIEQQNLRITLLNKNIKKRGLTWTAGVTSVSLATYAQRKCMFGHFPILGNTQGFEYHVDGVFNLKSNDPEVDIREAAEAAANPSVMADAFDWRVRHGATKSSSPYFNKASKGATDGWLSPVKNQGSCGSCWAHSTLSAAEGVINLYYNQHVDVDLSEQYIMECGQGSATSGKGCGGGYTARALSWVASHGVIDEASMPYTASDAGTCADSSKSPKQFIKFTGSVSSGLKSTADALKKSLIKYGPLNVSVTSLSHGMSLVAYSGDNWIFKNSWGPSKEAYKSVTSSMSNFAEVSGYVTPVISRNHTVNDVQCLDHDKDGYYNWGIGPKPAHCPESPAECDCDDTDPAVGPMDVDGTCKKITTGIVMHPIKGSRIFYNCIQNSVNKTAIINFETPGNIASAVRIFDMSGALVKNVPVGQGELGRFKAVWDGSNDQGIAVGTGIYLCRITGEKVGATALSSSFKIVVSE